jgi:hypothetical protein
MWNNKWINKIYKWSNSAQKCLDMCKLLEHSLCVLKYRKVLIYVHQLGSLHVLYLLQCQPVSGLGFRRGSYKCVCQKGFYFPDTTSIHKFFNGTDLEEEYAKILEVRRTLSNCFKVNILLGSMLSNLH